ncbi:MAG TPA: tail fiber domain-containing protein, partial [Tichowtungia sp.]|nr:tail fiber domain-containing protein [Tichowtungia sp.]
ENTTVGRVPFTIEGPAPSNSLYVDDGGRVGFGTSTPVVQNHIVDGNTPTVRLEQDGSSGFTAQTFDIAANEANFFVRDVTNGSQLPFRIKPGADSDSLFIAANNNIGVGTANPSASMHVRRSDGTAQIRLEEASGTAAERILLDLINNGKTRFRMSNTDAGSVWTFDNSGGAFEISRVGTGVAELIVQDNGDVRMDHGEAFAQAFNTVSSRTKKTAFKEIRQSEILDKLSALDISEWRYKADEEKRKHIGPMAEDFQAIFGFGDGRHLNLADVTGITLAAIQGLRDENQSRLDELEAENEALRDKVSEMYQIMAELQALK